MAEKDTPVDSTTPILDEEDETVSSEQDSLPLNESSQDSSYEGDDEGDDSYEDDDEGDEGDDEGEDSYEDDDEGDNEGEDSYEDDDDEGEDSYEGDEGDDRYATEGPDEEEAVDPVVFDKDIMGREEPEPKFKEYGVDDSNRKLELPNIPEYANRRNISMRHKLLENALLTPELIKLFDIICQNITMREKNYFNIADFLMSPNFSLTQKEHLQHNFFKLVDLLTDKTVDLVKVQERRPDNSAISISLNDSKNFDLVLFHKFNDFLLKNYNERNPLRKPILYQLEQIAENIKTTKEKLLPFCIDVPLQEINGEYLRKLISEEPENSGKLALAINLENEQFGEAIFPFRLAKELLPYLCRQIIEYLNNVRNEKTTILITRKLRESKIAYINIKKALMKPNPHNAEFSAFIRIFYNILSQVYQRNINYSTKKIKDTEIFLVLALVTRQLVLNAKLNTSQEDTSPKLITTNMVIHKLFEQAKEINRKVVCVPATLNTLVKKPSKYNGMKVKMNHDQLISAFQTLNSDVHTIKEILILRHDSTNYYLHRTCIVPLFINLLAEEKRKIKSAIEQEIRANRRILLKNKSSFEEFITQRVNLVLQLVYECLIRCLMTNKPIAYQDNQALYWMNRLFLTKEEVVRFELENTGFDFNEEEKRSIFKNLIKTLTYSNKNFKTIAEVLDVPYENYAHRTRFSLFNLIGRFLDRLFGVNTLNRISTTPPPTSDGTNKRPGLEYHRPEVDHHKPEPEHRRPKSDYPKSDLDYYIPELDNRRAIHKRPIASPHKKRTNFRKKARENTKKLIERFESKLPLLKEPATLQQKIAEELENWNLKLGESRKHNQQTIDGIINGCIVRLDNNEIAGKDFDSIYEVILRNNPPVGKIKNQDALKKYMMYKIIYNKYKRLAKG